MQIELKRRRKRPRFFLIDPRQFVQTSNWHTEFVAAHNRMILQQSRVNIFLYGASYVGKSAFLSFVLEPYLTEGTVLFALSDQSLEVTEKLLAAKPWSLVLIDDYDDSLDWLRTFKQHIETRTNLPLVIVSDRGPPPEQLKLDTSYTIVHAVRFSGDKDYLKSPSPSPSPPPPPRLAVVEPVAIGVCGSFHSSYFDDDDDDDDTTLIIGGGGDDYVCTQSATAASAAAAVLHTSASVSDDAERSADVAIKCKYVLNLDLDSHDNTSQPSFTYDQIATMPHAQSFEIF